MENPLISICIPTYKSDFLRDAITSVLSQTYGNIEVIVVNDSSPDRNIEPIVGYFKDKRIHYYKNKENIGGKSLVDSWNKCLEYIHGDFFCFLCDDDLYDKKHIEKIIKLTEQYPDVNVFKSRTNIIDSKGKIVDFTPASPEFETGYDYLWHILTVNRRQTLSELFFKTKFFFENGGFINLPLAWGSDQLTCIKLGFITGIVTSHEASVSFRVSDINLSAWNPINNKKKLIALLDFHEYVEEILIKQISDRNIKEIIVKANQKRKKDVVLQYLKVLKPADYFKMIKSNRLKEYATISILAYTFCGMIKSNIRHIFR